MTQAHPDDRLEWALAEVAKDQVTGAPGWYRARPVADETWASVNLKAATEVVVVQSREDLDHPHAWTVRVLFGDKAVELRAGPYEERLHAVWVAHALLTTVE
jgi:hypothetical protein